MTTGRLLSVNADVTIDVGGEIMKVRGDGSSLVVEVPSVFLAFQMLRQLPPLNSIRKRMAAFSRMVSAVGLTVVIRTPTRRLMTMGYGADSRLLKLFGIQNVTLHLT